IKKNDPLIISVNYLPDAFRSDFVFVTNRKRHRQMTDSLNAPENENVRIIATSNLTAGKTGFSYTLGHSELLVCDDEQFRDNSLLMLIKVLGKCGISEVNCAGFDGYSNKEDNYADPQMEYAFVKSSADHLNKRIRAELFENYKDMKFNFITYSKYTETEDCFDAAF
ncbi:MAG: 3-hydroxy-3-methylglutaryl-CoA lyase, partial [Huintestinicola sp.]